MPELLLRILKLFSNPCRYSGTEAAVRGSSYRPLSAVNLERTDNDSEENKYGFEVFRDRTLPSHSLEILEGLDRCNGRSSCASWWCVWEAGTLGEAAGGLASSSQWVLRWEGEIRTVRWANDDGVCLVYQAGDYFFSLLFVFIFISGCLSVSLSLSLSFLDCFFASSIFCDDDDEKDDLYV